MEESGSNFDVVLPSSADDLNDVGILIIGYNGQNSVIFIIGTNNYVQACSSASSGTGCVVSLSPVPQQQLLSSDMVQTVSPCASLASESCHSNSECVCNSA